MVVGFGVLPDGITFLEEGLSVGGVSAGWGAWFRETTGRGRDAGPGRPMGLLVTHLRLAKKMIPPC